MIWFMVVPIYVFRTVQPWASRIPGINLESRIYIVALGAILTWSSLRHTLVASYAEHAAGVRWPTKEDP